MSIYRRHLDLLYTDPITGKLRESAQYHITLDKIKDLEQMEEQKRAAIHDLQNALERLRKALNTNRNDV